MAKRVMEIDSSVLFPKRIRLQKVAITDTIYPASPISPEVERKNTGILWGMLLVLSCAFFGKYLGL